LKKVGPVRKGLVTENPEIVALLGTYQIPGMVVISMVLVSVVPSRIIIRSGMVQTSPATESIVPILSRLRSIGLLTSQLGLDLPVLISVSTHAMVELREIFLCYSQDQTVGLLKHVRFICIRMKVDFSAKHSSIAHMSTTSISVSFVFHSSTC
ncbi:MAG: hypothetical protein EZS28_037633, partial [Streblomastix strix]